MYAGLTLSLERKHLLPILLHVHHSPTAGLGFIETLVQAADAGLAVVGPCALGVGMVDIETDGG
jgi:hypothetical protein